MSGPFLDANGDVVSSALGVGNGYGHAHQQRFQQMALLPGQIQKVYALDDPGNTPGAKGSITVYDVLIHKANGATELIRRCQMLQPMFGGAINNHLECLTTDNGSKANDAAISLSLKRGSFVLLGFVHGHKQFGVILGTLPHSHQTAVKARPKKKQGVCLDGEFQGLHWLIDNDGNLDLTYNGVKADDGTLIHKDLAPTKLQIQKGNVTVSTNAKQSVHIDRADKTITVTSGKSTLVLKQEGEQFNLICDNINITANKDAQIKVNGKASVNVKGEATLSSETKINLARGTGTPSEPFVLGKKFADHYTRFINAVAAITHLGNLGTPTPPPLNAGQISGLASEVKELLSNLIVGDK